MKPPKCGDLAPSCHLTLAVLPMQSALLRLAPFDQQRKLDRAIGPGSLLSVGASRRQACILANYQQRIVHGFSGSPFRRLAYPEEAGQFESAAPPAQPPSCGLSLAVLRSF